MSIFRKALDRIRKARETDLSSKASDFDPDTFNASEMEILDGLEREILRNREYSEESEWLSVETQISEDFLGKQQGDESELYPHVTEDHSPEIESSLRQDAEDYVADSYHEFSDGGDATPVEDLENDCDDLSSSECDLEDFDEEDFLYDPTDGIEIYPDEDSPRFIDRYRRARQMAEMVGKEYDWSEKEIATLTAIFDVYGWNSAKRAIVRLLDLGVSDAELKLVFKLRLWWMHEHAYEFGSIYSTNISWLLAYKIVMSFGRTPDFEEIIDFVNRAFLKWQDDSELRDVYENTIQRYLDALSTYANTEIFCAPGIDWGDGYQAEGCELFEDEKDIREAKIEQFVSENF